MELPSELRHAAALARSAQESARDGCGPCTASCPERPECGCCAECITSGLDIFDSGVDLALPFLEVMGAVAGCFASPCAFPLVFCFSAGSEEPPDSGGWAVSVLRAPLARPLWCIPTCLLPCCGAQYFVRRRVLGGDMSRYKLFQGRHDGPHCLARCSPSLPFTLLAGTHGEAQCPHAFLCAESCLCSVCAFYASRDMMRSERRLGTDPTERRVDACLFFFGEIARAFAICGCCCQCAGCLTTCFAPDQFGEAGADCSRVGGACGRIAGAIYRGMWHVRNIAVACMSAQMAHESYEPIGGGRGAHTSGGLGGGYRGGGEGTRVTQGISPSSDAAWGPKPITMAQYSPPSLAQAPGAPQPLPSALPPPPAYSYAEPYPNSTPGHGQAHAAYDPGGGNGQSEPEPATKMNRI